MRQRLLLAARIILSGWITLLLIAYLLERPLLILIAGKLGGSWFPTVRLILDCSVLAGTGWVVGRLGPANPILAVAAFGATLTLGDFGELVELRVPWLLQLAWDALRDRRYWDSLFHTAVVQAFLFGSLIVGGLLGRRAPAIAPLIIEGIPKQGGLGGTTGRN
jgi:hypothetical protein